MLAKSVVILTAAKESSYSGHLEAICKEKIQSLWHPDLQVPTKDLQMRI